MPRIDVSIVAEKKKQQLFAILPAIKKINKMAVIQKRFQTNIHESA